MINKTKIDVPAGIRYLGYWNEFRLSNFQGHNILHKQLPGCGFTEFALTCSDPVVLCSPRKMLMENKKDQHGDDVYLVVNSYEVDSDIDENISKEVSVTIIRSKDDTIAGKKKEWEKAKDGFYTGLYKEIGEYLERMRVEGKVPKIIVTYDSTYLVKKILTTMGIIQYFYFCIDEFQSILDDARFKSDTEIGLLDTLREGINRVLYVSATPMLDKYLEKIPELNTLPYYELDWGTLDPSRIKKPNLKVRTMKSLSSKMVEIIQTYLDGNFEKVVVQRDGQLVEVESREAVFYVNSVNHIINIIKKMGLTSSQVNILCSDTPSNQKRIKKLGKSKGFKIGKVPLRGEPHKMFTFCTRTVYLGADFYSECARSFIFSDANSSCLSIDISIDMYQILGRERLDINPWKNCAEFYYKATVDYKKMTQEDLNNIIEKKIRVTENLIKTWSDISIDEGTRKDDVADTYKKMAKAFKYLDNYVAVNNTTPVFNNLVLINEQRAFDIQQVDYADRFSVFSSLEREFKDYTKEEEYISEFFSKYDELKTYLQRIKFICEYLIEHPDRQEGILNNIADIDKIKQQILTVGASRIKGMGYSVTMVNKAMGVTIFDQASLNNAIYSTFIVGKRYTNKFIKSELGTIYKSAGFEKTAKTTDLDQWFEVKNSNVPVGGGKREHGLEIIKKKG